MSTEHQDGTEDGGAATSATGEAPASPPPPRKLPGTLPDQEAQRRMYTRVGGCFVGLLILLFAAAYVLNQIRLSTTQELSAARLATLEEERDELRAKLDKALATPRLLDAEEDEAAYALAVYTQEGVVPKVWLRARRDTELWLGFEGRAERADGDEPGEETPHEGQLYRLAAGTWLGVAVLSESLVWLVHEDAEGSVATDRWVVPGAEPGGPPMVRLHEPEGQPRFVLAGLDSPVRLHIPIGEATPAVLTMIAASPGEASEAATGAAAALPVLYPLGGE